MMPMRVLSVTPESDYLSHYLISYWGYFNQAESNGILKIPWPVLLSGLVNVFVWYVMAIRCTTLLKYKSLVWSISANEEAVARISQFFMATRLQLVLLEK